MPQTQAPLFETDPGTETRALEEAERAIAQGRVVSHKAVLKWLRSWGKQDELPPPKCGE